MPRFRLCYVEWNAFKAEPSVGCEWKRKLRARISHFHVPVRSSYGLTCGAAFKYPSPSVTTDSLISSFHLFLLKLGNNTTPTQASATDLPLPMFTYPMYMYSCSSRKSSGSR